MGACQSNSKQERKQTEDEVNKTADQIQESFRSYGIKSGDAICICLPEIPEREIAKAVCKKLGVSDILFEPEKLSESLLTECLKASNVRMLIIVDWCSINGRLIPSKTIADRASIVTPTLEYIAVVHYFNRSISWLDGRDMWWDTLIKQ